MDGEKGALQPPSPNDSNRPFEVVTTVLKLNRPANNKQNINYENTHNLYTNNFIHDQHDQRSQQGPSTVAFMHPNDSWTELFDGFRSTSHLKELHCR